MAKQINLDPEVQAPKMLRRSVESNLNIFRSVGDIVGLFTADLGQTIVDFTDCVGHNNSLTKDSTDPKPRLD